MVIVQSSKTSYLPTPLRSALGRTWTTRGAERMSVRPGSFYSAVARLDHLFDGASESSQPAQPPQPTPF